MELGLGYKCLAYRIERAYERRRSRSHIGAIEVGHINAIKVGHIILKIKLGWCSNSSGF